MKAWLCEYCEAEVKQDEQPNFCPICHKKGKWTSLELPEQTLEDAKMTEKYNEAIKILDKYEEGTQPRTLMDATCGCCQTEQDSKIKHGDKK